MAFAQQPGSDIRPYDRLIGAALAGDRWLFARQDTVEAAWEVVDPVLGDVVPVHPYARGTWGPKEADRLLADRETWHDPAGQSPAAKLGHAGMHMVPGGERRRYEPVGEVPGDPAQAGDHRRRLR